MKEEILKVLEKHEIEKWGVVNDPFAKSFDRYQKWLEKGHNGILSYLEGERGDKRESISHYYEEFQSALVIAFDYSRIAKAAKEFYQGPESNGLKIANYVLGFEGSDYHFVLRDKLNALAHDLREVLPDLEIKHSLDTQPILERDLAMRAGIGWFGKNSMLINKDIGSYFILGSLFFSTDISSYGLPLGKMETDHCGNCTRCIDLCPTEAISPDSRTLIADKCISTFTIEIFKDANPPEGMENGGGEIYGCDICQDVCPWNKKRERKTDPITNEELSTLKEKNQILFDNFLTKAPRDIVNDLEGISNREYRRRMGSTPLGRTGRVGMLKNLKFYLKKD